MVRTRFAPSPTGYMHIGNLRTALYTYLIAKHNDGKFILRIEDTDQGRYVEGATDAIYRTLNVTGLKYDEGPDLPGDCGPYVQSERKSIYKQYALKLVESKKAYYCFCTSERLDSLKQVKENETIMHYDRHCVNLSEDEIKSKLESGIPYVIRQLIPEGETTFDDMVYGSITVNNKELDDQVLLKSDGLPTYNFANVVDDHLMSISHVIRGSEYLSSAPKYNLLYNAFGWDIPRYMHLPLILNINGEKLSKRNGDASFEDLVQEGYLPEAIINYLSLLGWSPKSTNEFFTLDDLIKEFDGNGIGKAPSVFDTKKLSWMNGEYFKKMSDDDFYNYIINDLKQIIKRTDIDLKKLSPLLKTRIEKKSDINNLVDFIDELPQYDIELYNHKKMKTDKEVSINSLKAVLNLLEQTTDFNNIETEINELIKQLGVKNSQMLWPIRIALSGKMSSPAGAFETLELLGKTDSINRIKIGIEKLSE